ncbi:DUF7305 domain-containing protein [Geosporobacter ferrireducens]|nr:PilX N-terminal domain-containing pilus assembly protein [Geosporobacter ferrireducens]
MMYRYLKNQKGGALVMVLVVMVVLSILGVSLLGSSVAETKFAVHQNNKIKAYFLAKSGAEATAAWMRNPANNGSSLINKTANNNTIVGIDGAFDIITTQDAVDPDLVHIKSIGRVNNAQSEVILTLKKTVTSSPGVFTNALSATNMIALAGESKIFNGDIQSGTINNSGGLTLAQRLNGYSASYDSFTASPFGFPVDPSGYGNILMKSSGGGSVQPARLNDDGSSNLLVYKKFTVEGRNTIAKINTGGTGNIVELVVEELDLQNGIFKIDGSGKLYIYVKSKAFFGNSATNFINETTPDSPSKLVLFLGNNMTSTTILDSNTGFSGFIYAPEADITIMGSRGFYGAIIGKNVTVSGQGKVYFDAAAAGSIGITSPIISFDKVRWEKP